MARIALENGTWFSTKSAKRYEEDTWFNGNNHISKATGSQWEHESLYCTKSGRWVLHSWSQWQGSTPSYCEIDQTTAYAWLRANGEWDAIPATEQQSTEI